jgi:hypothetical protein
VVELDGGSMVESRDVTFDERTAIVARLGGSNSAPDVKKQAQPEKQSVHEVRDEDAGDEAGHEDQNEPEPVQDAGDHGIDGDDAENEDSSDDSEDGDDGGAEAQQEHPAAQQQQLRRSARQQVPSRKLAEAIAASAATVRVAEALQQQEGREAIEAELKQLRDMGTYQIVDRPRVGKVVPTQLIVVRKGDGRWKARLVVCGNHVPDGVEDTMAPVASLPAIRTVLAHAAAGSWQVRQFDVKGAYLYAELRPEEYVHVQPPACAKVPKGKVWLVRRALYGLRQSGRRWNDLLDSLFASGGWRRSATDGCVYTKRDGHELQATAVVWVDDLCVAFKSRTVRDEFERHFGRHVTLTHKDLPSTYVGIELKRTDRGIKLTQTKYIEQVAELYGLQHTKPVEAPTTGEHLRPMSDDDKPCPPDVNMPSVVGALQYIACGTRPDIAAAVNQLAIHQSRPSELHWRAAKRVLKYLYTTRAIGIEYLRDGPRQIISYADADFANDETTRRSVTGYVVFFAGGPVAWKSKRQTLVTLSTAEAELVAASALTQFLSHYKVLLEELGDKQDTVAIYEDNRAVLNMCSGDGYLSQRTKHIDIRGRHVIEQCRGGAIKLAYVRSEENVADVLTKPLSRELHKRLVQLLRLH